MIRRALGSALAGVLAALLVAHGLVGSPAGAADSALPDPLYPADFPDPFVLQVGPTYVAYATNGPGGNVQVISSPDLRTWTRQSDALPKLPAWAGPGKTWAPAVLQVSPNQFVLYYAATHKGTGAQCVGRAVASSPLGPFVDELPQPFVCQFDRGGTIDPSPFQDGNGAVSLIVKSEGKPGEPTRIWSQPLTSDGTSLNGAPVQLAVTDQPWEVPIIEGPTMVRADGWYWLFYAGNDWASANYAIGDARCRTPQGPCVKDPRGPLLATSAGMAGPGSPGFVTGPDGRLLLTYHGWTAGKVGYPAGARTLRAQPLGFVDGRPALPSTPRVPHDGYRLVADDGGVFSFGSSGYFGSTGDLRLNSPIRTSAATPSGQGYWLAAGDGGIFSFGDAGFFGSTGSLKLNKPIVAMAPTMTGKGYWLVASDGGVFSFGDAAYLGSTGDLVLNSPIVAMMTTPWSDGYWMVAADGGMFAFGAAPFLGSAGGTRLAAPIVSAMATPGGDGYWLASADGGVLAFGAAPFVGAAGVAGGTPLNRPIVTMSR